MGLISADELKRWLNGFKETDNISPVYMRTLIDNQPTVEAIPIEWLEKEAEDWEYHNELVAAVLKSIIKGRRWEERK